MTPALFTKRFGIGLTGGIATGKSTVARILLDLGYEVIDADQLAREIVKPGSKCLGEIVAEFGASILQNDGYLDRRKLAGIIFSDKRKKALVEQIMHPAINERMFEVIVEKKLIEIKRPWFYEAALIVEAGTYRQFRLVWCTYCSDQEQLRRLSLRDKITLETAQRIVDNQMSLKEKMSRADLCIDTEKSQEALKAEVEAAAKDAVEVVKSQFVAL